MRRNTDGQHERAARTGFLRQFECPLDRRLVPGDDDLPRRIEIHGLGDFFARGVVTHLDYDLIAESEDGSHRADADRYCCLHELRSPPHDCQCIRKTDSARANQRRVFTEAVPCHLHRHAATGCLPDTPCGDSCGQHGRLRYDCLTEFFGRSILDQAPQIVAKHVACLGIGLANLTVLIGHVGLHALGLGSLPGKNHCDRQITLQMRNDQRRRIMAAPKFVL